MKKVILLLIVICITRFSSIAQLSYGVKAGINLASISFSDEKYNTHMKPGFLAGGFAHYPLNAKTGLQAELLFSTEGNKWDTDPASITGIIKSSQVRIPVLIQYKIHPRFALEAGPQFRWLITMKQTAVGATHSIKPLYYTGALGLAAGASFQLPGKFPGLKAGFRINRELSKINKKDVGGGTLHNTVMALSLAYTFKK